MVVVVLFGVVVRGWSLLEVVVGVVVVGSGGGGSVGRVMGPPMRSSSFRRGMRSCLPKRTAGKSPSP